MVRGRSKEIQKKRSSAVPPSDSLFLYHHICLRVPEASQIFFPPDTILRIAELCGQKFTSGLSSKGPARNIASSSALTPSCLQLPQVATITENQTIDLMKRRVTATIAHHEV